MRQLSWSWVLALVIFAHSTLATCAYSQIVKAPIQPAEVEELAAVLSSRLFHRLTLAQLSMLTQGCTEAELAMFEPVVDPLLAHVGYGGIGRRESEEAARIVVRIGKTAVPSLLDGLHSADERLRRMSINLLVRIDSREVALEKELIHLLNDRDDSVRQEVRRGLETVQKTSALTDKATATAIEARILVESPEIQLWLHQILARMPEHREVHMKATKSSCLTRIRTCD